MFGIKNKEKFGFRICFFQTVNILRNKNNV